MNAPHLARLLIRLATRADRRDDALGDLEETHQRHLRDGRVCAWWRTTADACVIAWVTSLHRGPRHGMTGADLRLGVRLIKRNPLLALTSIVALTVAIGLATVGFAMMEALLFSRLPFEHGDRFVRLVPMSAISRQPVTLTPPGYARIAAMDGLAHLGAITGTRSSVTLPDGGMTEALISGITPSSFRYLPAVPMEGRLLTESDAQGGQPPVALMSETYWRRTLNGDAAVVDAEVTIGGARHTIVGVLPATFEFPDAPDFWIPLDEGFRHGARLPDSDARLFGVRAPGTSLGELRAQLTAVAPQVQTADDALAIDAAAFTDIGPMALDMATAIIATVVAVLLVIAANVGNLVLARSIARAREFALRAALGASRGRLVWQVIAEVLVLGAIAAILGSLGAQAVLRQLNAMDELPFWVDFTGGPLTLVLVASATVLATMVAGAWPAWRATRRDLLPGLQGGGRTSDVQFGRTAGVMVVVQIAVSVAMLHGALVVTQAFRDYATVDIDLPTNVLVMGMNVNAVRSRPDGTRSVPLTAEEVERIAAGLPGVIAAGVTSALPRHSPRARVVEVDAGATAASTRVLSAPSAEVSASYFDALETPVVAGRGFSEADGRPGAAPVAVVNEPFVARMFDGGPAIGRRLRVVEDGLSGPWMDVVGVVPDLGLSVGDPSLSAGYYTPLSRDTNQIYVAMRVAGEPLLWSEPLRIALRERDPDLSPFAAQRLEDVAIEDRAFFAGLASALVGVGVVTLVLALVGVYSMMSLVVTRRTREIGIRMALGAGVSQVARTIGSRAAMQVGLGGMMGALLAVVSLEARAILVSRMGDGGPWTLPVVITLLALAGLAATWIPLRRALRIRPQDALRTE